MDCKVNNYPRVGAHVNSALWHTKGHFAKLLKMKPDLFIQDVPCETKLLIRPDCVCHPVFD